MSGQPLASLRMIIDSRFECVRLAGVALQAMAESLCYPRPEVRDMQLAVVEALNNAVKHAYREEPGHEITIDWAFSPQGVEVVIGDTGLTMNGLKVKQLEFDPDDLNSLPEGGMGLFLIRQIVDEMDYCTFKTENRMRLFKKMKPV